MIRKHTRSADDAFHRQRLAGTKPRVFVHVVFDVDVTFTHTYPCHRRALRSVPHRAIANMTGENVWMQRFSVR